VSRNARRYRKRAKLLRQRRRRPPKEFLDLSTQGTVHSGSSSGSLGETCASCKTMLHNSNKSEPAVCQALRFLTEERPRLSNTASIVTYLHVRPSSQLDAEKIDFLVLLSNRQAVAFQVKSSPEPKSVHDKKYPYIPCFLESGRSKPESVARRLHAFLSGILADAR
jgi:hypothetical protein